MVAERLLRVEHVTKRFGGLVAVDDVSLTIDKGELFAIVGPNGAGKTTLFNLINGVLLPDEGRILYEGEDITRLAVHRKATLGIGRTFQIPRPFGTASVRENIAIGTLFGRLAGKVSVAEALAIADDYIDRVGLQVHGDKLSAALTPVEKKLMEIARALAMRPKLLLLDEAMAGMNPKDIDELVDFLKRIKEQEGVAVIALVEHIMRAVAGLAERVMVMHQGGVLTDASTEAALTHPEVIAVYLGKPPSG
jgi:branched-chain amino acid transport system ATP-binding protein